MLKIRALNRESSSDEDFPAIRREAQEEIALELYNKALRLQATGDLTESELILLKLIEENIPLLENNGGLPKSMSTLKYSCFVNIGNIYLKKNELIKALDKYTIASELDSTDVTLWYKLGKLALQADKFRQSVYAFSKGLECSETHWPCLDQLISLLYAIKDTVRCLEYIGKALMLDADYTKGLVLRRQIYRDNPATKEYYQLYNPNYIWEPPLDIPIDEDDEKLFLDEVQKLTNRITEVEKAIGPKSLQTIPLSKPLESYTWISLAKTVLHLHKYITDNGMSHFTMVDINKCMSQHLDPSPILPMEIEDIVQLNQKLEENKVVDNVAESNDNEKEDKTDGSPPPERRFSQNSENNNDIQENTPVQTDNDEELPTEQETEEQDENSESKVERGRPRGTKRRRDLVSELQIWGWHSKRRYSKKGKPDKDFSIEDALNRIIPKTLMKQKLTSEKNITAEDSMNTMDLYNMFIEDTNVNFLSPIHSPKSINSEPYFGTDREKDDVQQFWTKKREYCDAVILIKELVFALAQMWNLHWPKELVNMYIEAYNMFREHYDLPEIFSEETSFEDIRCHALAALLIGELQSFSSDSKELVHVSLLSFIQMVSGWQESWKEEFPCFFNRVHWLRTHIFIKENNNDLAIRALQLVQEVIFEEETKMDDKYFLHLPNCFKCGLLTNSIIEKILKHLDLVTSLSNLEELFNAQKYIEVADIIKITFNNSGNHPQVGRMGRPAQLAVLLHSLWFIDLIDCFVWTEKCLHEATEHYFKPAKDSDKWDKLLGKCLAFLREIIKTETVSVVDCLVEDKRCRLTENLIKIIRKQLNENYPKGFTLPWILLHYVLLREEHRQQASKRVRHTKTEKVENLPNGHAECKENELPPSVAILFSAHEFLGPKGWCLEGQGELLHFILDTVLDRLDTPIFELLREKIDIHIEQALFCLYQHPSKNNKISRHLADHNVDPLPLTWERSFQLYEFYGPDCLPEFNSYKNASISSDSEQLLKRIIALVPSNCDPKTMLPKVIEFIHGKSSVMPEPMEFPNKVRAIYYLIGDYYFKQRQFKGCIKYFQIDLCINPLRLDSWACLGLSYVSELESNLNYCKKFKTENEFLDSAKSAQICFRKALTLSPDHLMLWIEFGSFEYMVHSFCSRLLKHESENFSMERFEYLENQKNSYLDSSGSSFEKAIALYELENENEADERWLQYYILGKIAEKKQKEPSEYLQYYITASTLLHENNAIYPDKINYHNPQHLAVEALELHYRIHASVLKYLELHEGKEISNSLGAFFKKCLNATNFLKNSTSKSIPKPPVETVVNLPGDFQNEFLKSVETSKSEFNNSIIDKKTDLKREIDNLLSDVKDCLNDVLIKVDEMDKETNKIDACKENSTLAPADVIMISDSDEDVSKIKEEHDIEVENVKSKSEIKDVQKFLDEMMETTMKMSEQPMDSSCKEEQEELKKKDSSDASTNIEKVEEKNKFNKPIDSETDTDNRRTSADDSSSSSSSTSSSSSSSESDSEEDSSSSSSSSSSENENMCNNDILHLVDRCIAGLEICIIRLPQNYKALYRLAHLYFNYKGRKDYTKCKQLLLGEYKCKDGTIITGLFSSRKANDFFHGIWRIPSSEIDRPGSLSAHMSRCVSLLLQILRATNDNKTLIELSMQLRKTPDQDKIYIKDSERLQFSEQAMSMCTQTLRTQMKNLSNMTNPQIVKLLQDIFKVYQRVQKHLPTKENIFASMLTDVYKQFIKEKIADNANILDLATKFCQQNKPIEKPKPAPVISAPQLPPPKAPGILSPPVHPSPVAITSPIPTTPLKRPGAGRPRGRPPLPKIPGQQRIPKSRNPNATTNPYSWRKPTFEQKYVYEYLKQYQEQLIQQYSQSLSIPQLAQLTQLFTQGQLTNPIAGDTLSKFLHGQTGMMNTNNLMKQMSTGSSMTTNMDALNQLNLTSNMSIEQMLAVASTSSADPSKLFSNLQPSVSKNVNPISSTSKSSISQHGPSKKAKTTSSLLNTLSSMLPSRSNFSTSDAFKHKVAPTKTSTQLFKEPIFPKILKPISSPTTTSPISLEIEKNPNLIMKDRPNISITPVTAATTTLTTATTSVTKSTQMSVRTSSASIKPGAIPMKSSSATLKSSPLPMNMNSSPIPLKSSVSMKSSTVSVKSSALPINSSTVSMKSSALPMNSSMPLKSPPVTMRTSPISTSSTNFSKIISTSPGKTLQEKLADKQKQQLKQHLKKNIEADIFAQDSSAALMKSLNLSTIPSSLTVSKAQLPTTSAYTMDALSMTKTTSINPSKYTIDIGRPIPKQNSPTPSKISIEPTLPSSLTVSKATNIGGTTFPLDSGISISQVPVIQPSKSSEHLRKENISIISTKASSVSISHQKEKSKVVPSKKDLGRKHTIENMQREMQLLYSQMSIEQIAALSKDMYNSEKFFDLYRPLKDKHPPKSSSQTSGPTRKEAPILKVRKDLQITDSSHTKSSNSGLLHSHPEASIAPSTSKINYMRKESLPVYKASSYKPAGNKSPSRKSSSDDDVICID